MERKYWVHENTGGRIRLYTYCIGHMTKTWWVSEKEGKESKSVANSPLDLVYGLT